MSHHRNTLAMTSEPEADSETDGDGRWAPVGAAADIWPNTGVCARVGQRHVAVFRVGTDQWFAIDNIDPKTKASVLSRGLLGNLGERTVVASPLNKYHYDLRSGECLEDTKLRVAVHAVRVQGVQVQVQVQVQAQV